MSIELVSRVLRKSGYGGAEQQVLVILCDYADDQGYCYPSMLRIAWETGLTERAVRNIMRRLEAAGTVETTEHRGARNSNEYRINLDTGPQKEPWETYRDRHKRPSKSERGSVTNQNVVPVNGAEKPEGGSEINRNVVPPKSEPDDRKSEPDDKKPERRSGEPSVEPLVDPPEEPPVAPRASEPTDKRASRAPAKFEPTDEQYQWAWLESGMSRSEIDGETAKFLDFHRAKGSLMVNWVAGWRNWIRKAVEIRTDRAQRQSNGRGWVAKPSNADISAANIDAAEIDRGGRLEFDNEIETTGRIAS